MPPFQLFFKNAMHYITQEVQDSPPKEPTPEALLTCFIDANPKYTQDVGRIKFLHGTDLFSKSFPH